MDYIGPLSKTKSGNKYLHKYTYTTMCRYTHFLKAISVKNIKASQIADSLVNFSTFIGLLISVPSDQGSNFISSVMQQLCFN